MVSHDTLPIESDGTPQNEREESNPSHPSLLTLEQSSAQSSTDPSTSQAISPPSTKDHRTHTDNMFCSPLQPSDPFDFFTSPPCHAYRRQQAYNDPITTALLNEQARREAAYEREREQRIRRRLAYEEHQRQQQARARAAAQAQSEREADLCRARRIAAARQEYERQVRDLFLAGYRPASQGQEHEEEEDEEREHSHQRQPQAEATQSYIPIKSYEDVKQSEDEIADTESEAEESEDTVQEEDNTATASASHQIQIQNRPEDSKPKITYEEAVSIVHKHAQVALTIRRRLGSLNKVRASFEAQQSQFRPPATLDFDMARSKTADQPVLAYTSNNRPLQAYEESLLRLLTDLDDIPSGGHEQIKKARKALARDINAELTRIDSYKLQLWERR